MKKTFAALLSGVLFVLWLLATIILGGLAIVAVFPLIILIAFPEIVICWIILGGLILYFGGLFGEYQPEWLRSLQSPESLEGPEDSD
jgi:hypothetical protein